MDENCYRDKKVLITGGLGFLGSSIAHKLVPLGARVTILDSLNPLYGGNLFNLEGIRNEVEVVYGDIRDISLVEKLIAGQSIVFNLAAQVSYIDSNSMPYEDLDVNCRGHMILLEACRQLNREIKVVFASSRMVLGKSESPCLDESHPTNPLSLYGIHKLAAEKYHLMYYQDFGIRSVVIRITNPYGPRQQMKHSKYCLPGWFMRQAMNGEAVRIFGDGRQLRDYVYVDDVAEAFVQAAITDETNGQVYHCGRGVSTRFRDMAEMVVNVVGRGRVEYVPWPPDYEKIETGDLQVTVEKLVRATGWRPRIELEAGLEKMYWYYGAHLHRYVCG